MSECVREKLRKTENLIICFATETLLLRMYAIDFPE